MKNEETAGIIIVVAIVVVLILGYNFLGKIKTAPISLVPSGTQQAVNPTSQAALNAGVIGTSLGTQQALNNQYAMQNYYMQQQSQADLINAYGNAGNALGNLIGNISGSNSGDYYGGY